MQVSFTLYGLSFSADVTYFPGTPDVWYLPNGDPGYPGDPPEVEILDLKVGDSDASFLCDSSLVEDIYAAAAEAYLQQTSERWEDEKADRAAERYWEAHYARQA